MGNVLESARAHAAPVDNPIGRLAQTKGMATLPDDLARKVQGSFHPLVRTHPRTGERALYCDQTYAAGIEGLEPEEAAPILEFLRRAHHPARVHLPPALGSRDVRHVGQPAVPPSGVQRLRRPSARAVSLDGRRRASGLSVARAVRHSLEATRRADQTEDQGLQIAQRAFLGFASTFAGRLVEGLESCETACRTLPSDPALGVEFAGHSPFLGILMTRAWLLARLGRLDEATAVCDRAEQLARAHGDVEVLTWMRAPAFSVR